MVTVSFIIINAFWNYFGHEVLKENNIVIEAQKKNYFLWILAAGWEISPIKWSFGIGSLFNNHCRRENSTKTSIASNIDQLSVLQRQIWIICSTRPYKLRFVKICRLYLQSEKPTQVDKSVDDHCRTQPFLQYHLVEEASLASLVTEEEGSFKTKGTCSLGDLDINRSELTEEHHKFFPKPLVIFSCLNN